MSATGNAGNQTIVLAPCAASCGQASSYWLGSDPDCDAVASRGDFGDLCLKLLRLHGEDWLREQRGGLSCACLGDVVTLDGDTLVHLAWRAQDRSAARAGALQ